MRPRCSYPGQKSRTQVHHQFEKSHPEAFHTSRSRRRPTLLQASTHRPDQQPENSTLLPPVTAAVRMKAAEQRNPAPFEILRGALTPCPALFPVNNPRLSWHLSIII